VLRTAEVNALLAQIAVGLHKHARMRLVRQRKERLAPLLDQLQRFSSLLELMLADAGRAARDSLHRRHEERGADALMHRLAAVFDKHFRQRQREHHCGVGLQQQLAAQCDGHHVDQFRLSSAVDAVHDLEHDVPLCVARQRLCSGATHETINRVRLRRSSQIARCLLREPLHRGVRRQQP
jgi:hypothetical protein